jgi:hypothetical protein
MSRASCQSRWGRSVLTAFDAAKFQNTASFSASVFDAGNGYMLRTHTDSRFDRAQGRCCRKQSLLLHRRVALEACTYATGIRKAIRLSGCNVAALNRHHSERRYGTGRACSTRHVP